MIRIRPGRSWRMNPVYASELTGLEEQGARGFDGGQILDVLGIEVDGVDIAAGVGEARVLLAVDELLQALLHISNGEGAAQATIGPGPTELVLESRGEDLLLTLASLAPPSKLLAAGLLVDAEKMRVAVLHAARGLLLDLLSFSPRLGSAQVSQRLSEASARLAHGFAKPVKRWPKREAPARTIAFKAPGGSETLSLSLPPETMARVLAHAEVPHAPLAAHLGAGAVSLSRKGAPGLSAEGPAFFLLRNLLEEADALIEACESGQPSFTLRFGPHELRWDLPAGEVRASGWRTAARLPPLRFASLLTQAARAYADLSLRRSKDDELAQGLRDRATRLDRHCQDLQTGDLRRASAVAPTAPPPAPAGPLAQRMRRLVYREAWRLPLEGEQRILPGEPFLIEGVGALTAHDPATGEKLWTLPAEPGVLVRGGELFFSEPGSYPKGGLQRVEAATGEVRWKRRLRGAAGPGQLWPLSKGVLRGLPGEGLAFVDDAGALGFRVKLPGGAPKCAVEAPPALVVALPAFCMGLDKADGAVLWKRRAAVRELIQCGPHVLLLEAALPARGGALEAAKKLACLDPRTGKVLFQAPVPQDAHSLRLDADAVMLIAAGQVLAFSLHDLSPRPARELPWVEHLALEHDPDSIIATGAGGAAQRLDGKRWTIEPDGGPSRPARQRRGVVLLSRTRNELRELASGLPLASLPAGEALLCDDLACAIRTDGQLVLHRLATHLSLL
ncbi:MAG TPA: PQQ-binding-like beta-propeller repeat protein [Myxococcales bacterium]|nr:PQQ-binding-like beta-propeller repeat protein [Myxococcales bacterium]